MPAPAATRSIPLRYRRVLFALAVAAASLGLAACSSGGGGSSTTTTIPGY